MMMMTMMTNTIPYRRTKTHIWDKVLMGIWVHPNGTGSEKQLAADKIYLMVGSRDRSLSPRRGALLNTLLPRYLQITFVPGDTYPSQWWFHVCFFGLPGYHKSLRRLRSAPIFSISTVTSKLPNSRNCTGEYLSKDVGQFGIKGVNLWHGWPWMSDILVLQRL